ncbi:GPW/gp25 family protein [Pseudomonas fluorescens]|uniref:GPW/gp25 family protein n=1 Tax=Pseudomonas fluorescens TaxID=294 RepID=UPI0019067D01|nr:GPW/gp25 family protein [Pseudomonas fluorescens]MBD8093261.1 GPW/gp25 family protein [Pseudomonas fluorescens]MBD8719214.1 GPW/gp25 family protein [Pseudomonas fluorescens]
MSIATASLLDRLISSTGACGNDLMAPAGSVERLCHELAQLFNSTGLGSLYELHGQPRVARSVLNCGLGNFAGVLLSSVDLKELEVRIRNLIRDFEPRVLSHNLQVQLLPGSGSHSHFTFLLHGEIRHRASPWSFRLHASWNTESGEVSVQPYGNHHG